ncbi:hypothetical protein Tsubulata_029240 [Turnera subulata]|uniref:Protein kinase domain-containing protein n=1 Tax=Turnera subulata TaxID=218843 RepID=A0A9Q0G9Q5_9ROSI|nr:hypothetical protein Tsubulata_029240 [Turnera subulata]
METEAAPRSPARFITVGEQQRPSSLEAGMGLMYMANEGDLVGMKEVLESAEADVNFRDIDGRTALHVAACQGNTDIVRFLLDRGAVVEPKDRWGSTPLADAVYYKHHEVIKLLEEYGAQPPIAPMHVQNAREVPEYEIDPAELDFSNSSCITKGTFRIAMWRGIQVAVKTLGEELFTDEDKVNAFRDELALLQKIRHPNVVQFLGAVTQSTPMMIITEYLPKGDLCAYLNQKGALKRRMAVKLALDIARGMNYLHENKPEAILHRDLQPTNILRDDSGHLKVADFGVSKLLKVAKIVKEDKPCQDTSWRYVAPELYRNEGYDTKVDVFPFALILQEVSSSPHLSFSLLQQVMISAVEQSMGEESLSDLTGFESSCLNYGKEKRSGPMLLAAYHYNLWDYGCGEDKKNFQGKPKS